VSSLELVVLKNLNKLNHLAYAFLHEISTCRSHFRSGLKNKPRSRILPNSVRKVWLSNSYLVLGLEFPRCTTKDLSVFIFWPLSLDQLEKWWRNSCSPWVLKRYKNKWPLWCVIKKMATCSDIKKMVTLVHYKKNGHI
jgi:hypothetical protein